MTALPGPGPPGASGGLTLLEVVVVLALLGLSAGIAGLAFRQSAGGAEEGPGASGGVAADAEGGVAGGATGEVAAARRRALEEGRRVEMLARGEEGVVALVAFPDGSVVAESELADRLTGRVGPGR